MTIENRTYTIENKVFEPNHIKNLARLFQEEYNSSTTGKSEYSIKERNIGLNFHLKCIEPISFESDSEELFKDNSKAYTKRIKTIEMHFKEGNEKRIKLVIQHGDDYDKTTKTYNNTSYLEVSGKNEMWVNGMLSKLMDYLQSVPTQKRGILNYDQIMFYGLCLLGGYLTIIGISLNMCRNDANYYLKDLLKTDGLLVVSIMIIILSLFPGVLFAIPIHNWIERIKHNVFPSIELLLGPEHLLVSKIKKRRIIYVWTVIVLPIIISILCNIVTNYIN